MFEVELRRGPVSSQVDEVGIHELPVLMDGSPFRVER
jgi:hypothetical protein